MRSLPSCLTLLLVVACGGSERTAPAPKAPSPTTSQPARPAPRAAPAPQDVDAPQLRQELTRSSDRPRVYNFWATWCAPCIGEMPLLRTFAEKHQAVDVVLVNVDHPSLHKTRVAKVLDDHALRGLTHLMLQAEDPNEDLKGAVKDWPEQIPVTLVVDGTGREVERFTESLKYDALVEAVARAQ